MGRFVVFLALLAACGPSRATPDRDEPEPVSDRVREQEEGLAVERKARDFTDRRPPPKATDEEAEDFARVWEFYRRNLPEWPVERDRYKRRSEAAGYVLAGHLLRHYMRVNGSRARHAKELVRVKDEIVAVGAPCAPSLVDMMVLDQIAVGADRFWTPDDLTRQDCLDMLERIGEPAVPALLRALKRPDLGIKGRRFVALSLGGTRDQRAYDPLVKLLLADDSWQVRADAASALAKLGDRRALVPLAEARRKDPDPAVVRRAGKAAYELQPEKRS